MKNTIKYQNAENSSGKLININEINKGESIVEKYFCINCKEELLPRLGNIRIHHFSHKNDVYNCSKETYLHELGKRVFYETYLQCLENNIPFNIISSLFNSIVTACKYYKIGTLQGCKIHELAKFDLTQSFKNIEYEINQGNFRPDLTLKNENGDNIFIEIAVTHLCEKEKIESKNKIIELSIKDEEDINIILGKNLSEENNNIKFYNFENFYIFVEPFCKENLKLTYLIILKNGEKHLVKVIKRELCKFAHENSNSIAKIIPFLKNAIPLQTPKKSFSNLSRRLIDEIDSNMDRRNYRKKYSAKKRRK
jgi:hypothetical protein